MPETPSAQPKAGTGGTPGAPDPRWAPGKGFVHLHLHSEYSLLDGGNRVDRLVKRALELGMPALGVTDHGNMFGAASFYLEAKEKGLKPILGVEAYVTPWPGKRSDRKPVNGGGYDGAFHLVLLAQNNAGWQNLLHLCSEAFLTGFYYKPRVDRELLEAHSEGLVAICGHLGSEIGDHLLDYERSGGAPGSSGGGGDDKFWQRAVEAARWHARVFPGRFYVELQHHVPEQVAILPHLVRLARELDLPLLADNDAHFLNEEDHDAHDTLICISTGKTKDEPDRMRYDRQLYVKSPAQMRALCDREAEDVRRAWAEGCDNTLKVARECDVELPVGKNNAPMVRVTLPRGEALPRVDDARFAGDLTAWYKAYCASFEVLPFTSTPSAEEMASARTECDTALRMLAEAGYVWRYGVEGIGHRASGSGGVEPEGTRHQAPGTRGKETEGQEGKAAGASPVPANEHAERRARLERELKILADKGISAYFLIVWDFVNWGRQRGIPALARGSGVGTMVGYVLGLSNACPVRYGLLFERFTDPDRSEFPDIDIDLCQFGRGDVIDYVRAKYGHVAQIITFGTLKARAAVRDVGRVLGMTPADVDKVAKLIPETLNITLDEAMEQEPELKKRYEGETLIKRLLDNARLLEGHTRHAGVHAAGVIVATRPLREVVPLYKPTGAGENEVVTQWDGPTCEKMGLLKMDFLGLRTLTTVERAKALIREGLPERAIWDAVGRGAEYESRSRAVTQSRSGKVENTGAGLVAHPLDLDRLSFTDPRVFDLFQRGETTGVFQFESPGMRRLLMEMKPDRLEDLIAANALFRPGPMDLIPDYNRRKHGQDAVPKVHPIVERYTAETYGVMVYQEQVMQIVHGLGGIKLRDAYTLIKNISKKKHDKIEKERPKFVDGAQKQGLDRKKGEELFELILKFAGYGFNKSHSTGYAIVAYQTAYLKTYFPAQYMAAFLTYESQANKASEWIPYLEDTRKTRVVDPATGRVLRPGIEVKPPDINLSEADFSVVFLRDEARTPAHGHIRFGLKAIKGAGDKAIEAILTERRGGGPAESTSRGGGPAESTSRGAGPAEIKPAPSAGAAPRVDAQPFTSLHEFCERVMGHGPGTINKATVEALVKCGAFDSVHGREQRAAMVATIEGAMSAGQKSAADRAAGQGALFGFGGGFGGAPAGGPASGASGGAAAGAIKPGDLRPVLAKVEPWTEAQTLAEEKGILGFYVSSHPLDRWRAWVCAFTRGLTTLTAKDRPHDERVVLAGLVQSVRALVVKNGRSAGQKMAVITLEDMAGTLEFVLFADNFARYGHLAEPDKSVFVLGRVDRSRGEPQVIADKIVPIDGVPLVGGRLQIIVDERRLNGASRAALEHAAATVRELASGGVSGGVPGRVSGHGPGANGVNGSANGASGVHGANGAASASSAPVAPSSGGGPDKSALPVELLIVSGGWLSTLHADASLRVPLSPEGVDRLAHAVGPGLVRVEGGLAVEMDKRDEQRRQWSKKPGGGGGGSRE